MKGTVMSTDSIAPKKTDREIAEDSYKSMLQLGIRRMLEVHKTKQDYVLWFENSFKNFFSGDTKIQFRSFKFFELIIMYPDEYYDGPDYARFVDSLIYVHDNLPELHQEMMRQGFHDLILGIPCFPDANDPSVKNSYEYIALQYLKLMVRLNKKDQLFELFNHLVHFSFPKSQAVFDAALLRFRIAAEPSLVGEWHELFCSTLKPPDARWHTERSLIVVIGMSEIYKERPQFFFNEWSPFQDYVRSVQVEPESRLKENTLLSIENAKKYYGV